MAGYKMKPKKAKKSKMSYGKKPKKSKKMIY